jgi:hypothetical protein
MLSTITGTLDEMEPALRAAGFVAIRMMSGDIDLSTADPYGMRRVGSVNIPTERWAHHVWRGRVVEIAGIVYLTDAKPASPGFLNGLFELVRA